MRLTHIEHFCSAAPRALRAVRRSCKRSFARRDGNTVEMMDSRERSGTKDNSLPCEAGEGRGGGISAQTNYCSRKPRVKVLN